MKITMFSSQPYDERSFEAVLAQEFGEKDFEFHYQAAALSADTVALAQGSAAVCVFVNDTVDAPVLEALSSQGVKAVLLRCAGFNNVDLGKAKELGMFVARVPAYSPEAVAEHALALTMTLNRHTHRAFNRVREGNFALDGLLGFNLHGKTVGIVGTGKIGVATARIFAGFGCEVLGFDPYRSDDFEQVGEYVELDELLSRSKVVSLHCPLMDATHHMIDAEALAKMQDGAMLVNTSRGGLVDTSAVIEALKSKKLGGLAIDVYEQESGLFFQDLSSEIIDDDVFQRLLTFPNVLVTGHQAFFTQEALHEIADVTLGNLAAFADGTESPNALVPAA